jgi:hypothetical protein
MYKQVLVRKNNRIHAIPNYFARAQGAQVLGFGWKPISNIRTEKAIVYKKFKNYTLQAPEFVHLLKVATDLNGATIASDRLSLDKDGLTIDGVAVEANDLVEISNTLGTALNILPGTWKAESSSRLVMENPPVYTISNIWSAIGAPWSFRVDVDTGDLIGLAPISPLNQTFKQGNAAANVGSPGNMFDGDFWTEANWSNVSYQILGITHDEIEIRRLALKARSVKVAYENSYKRAGGQLRINGTTSNQLFAHYETGSWAWNSGTFSWALASTEYWQTGTYEPAAKSTSLGWNKDGGGRGYLSVVAYGDLPCQITVGGVKPTAGSSVVITDAIAEQMRPVVEAGTYTLIENSATAQWRLQKQ